jgi:hypothetical protein
MIEENAENIRFVPKKIIVNKDLYLIAVQKDPHVLRYVPKRFRTEELCITAFNSDPSTIEYFPKNL